MAGGTKHRFVALDSLRGVCACMIVLYHFGTAGFINSSTFVQHGFLFVDFFFVLSGFVIASSYGDRISDGYPIGKFMILRLGRIYPLHFVVLLAFVTFELVSLSGALPSARAPFTGNYSIGKLVAELLLIQPFVGSDTTPWNGPSWSIAVELWTYLVFALLFRFLGRWLVPVALLLALASGCYLAVVTDRYLNVFHDGAFARCLFGFSLGVVTFHLFRKVEPIWGSTLATLCELAAVVATVLIVIAAGASSLSLIVPPIFAFAVFVFARQGGVVAKILMLPPFEFVGKISYSIYLIHLFIVYRTNNALQFIQRITHYDGLIVTAGERTDLGPTPLMGDVMSLAMLALVIGMATLSYRYIEFPANQWVRRKVSSKAQIASIRE